MAEIIAANLDGLKTPALDHFRDRAVDTADGWKAQYAAIGSPLRHGLWEETPLLTTPAPPRSRVG